MENIEERVINALRLQSENGRIISATKHKKSISFSVHTQECNINCADVIIRDITRNGDWLEISGLLPIAEK